MPFRVAQNVYTMPISQMSHASVSCFGTLLGSPVTFIGYMFLQNEKEKPEKMKMEEIARSEKVLDLGQVQRRAEG